MYIIISTPIPPKKSLIFGRVFSECFFGQTTKSTHIFMKECRNVENKNRHFAPFQEKNMREISAIAEGLDEL